MEDDDEFGDLYTDVLMPFSSTSAAPQPHQPSSAPAHLHRSFDLNLQSQSHSNGNTLFGATPPISASKTLVPFKSPSPPPPPPPAPDRDLAPEPMVLDSKQEPADEKDVEFVVKDGGKNGIECVGSDDPIIPGLAKSVQKEDFGTNNNGSDDVIRVGGGGQAEDEGEGDDWDSDSEDDLQIVLNDNNHGPMATKRGIMGEDDDDDEDGDPLVIVADGDASQGAEEQEWGEEGGPAADGERKEGAEAGKGGSSGGSVVVPKIGYSSHGYHSFHSQFKVSVLTC